MGAQIISDGRCFSGATKRPYSLQKIIMEMFKRAKVPLFDVDDLLPRDPPPLTLFWLGLTLLLGAREVRHTWIVVAGRSWVQTTRTHSRVQGQRGFGDGPMEDG